MRYLIAWEDDDADREEAAKIVPVLYDDGEHIIVRYRPELSELLPELGFVLKIMSATPINYTAEEAAAERDAGCHGSGQTCTGRSHDQCRIRRWDSVTPGGTQW